MTALLACLAVTVPLWQVWTLAAHIGIEVMGKTGDEGQEFHPRKIYAMLQRACKMDPSDSKETFLEMLKTKVSFMNTISFCASDQSISKKHFKTSDHLCTKVMPSIKKLGGQYQPFMRLPLSELGVNGNCGRPHAFRIIANTS